MTRITYEISTATLPTHDFLDKLTAAIVGFVDAKLTEVEIRRLIHYIIETPKDKFLRLNDRVYTEWTAKNGLFKLVMEITEP